MSNRNRWVFYWWCISVFSATGVLRPMVAAEERRPLNVLLITADDMNWDSLGVTGCKIPNITPHLDRFASESIRFENAFVNVALCGPCRSILLTGRYAHRNGAMGFKPIYDDVPTLGETLRAAGYINGIMGKTNHQLPYEKFCWDYLIETGKLGTGRDPESYYRYATEFFERGVREGKPFFLMANSNDPHRPFPPYALDTEGRRRAAGKAVSRSVTRWFTIDDIDMPAFLPDIPQARREVAQYFTAVHRCDATVGRILQALDDSGLRDNTITMFLSDHGMPMPFAKANCYVASNKTPWIVRWPGTTKPGSVDAEHFISTIDFMPTILDATGLAQVMGMDGRSFVPLLNGKKQANREFVFTSMDQVTDRLKAPMRCVMNKHLAYIYNPWADGKTKFLRGVSTSAIPAAMEEAAKTDTAIARRLTWHFYRSREELYDLQEDPHQLDNLAGDRKHAAEIREMRNRILDMMESTNDPQLAGFRACLVEVRKQEEGKTP